VRPDSEAGAAPRIYTAEGELRPYEHTRFRWPGEAGGFPCVYCTEQITVPRRCPERPGVQPCTEV
jgi:hypothetical protein